MSITVVGRCPPPLGGVSVYVSRRYAELKSSGGTVNLIDFSEKKWLLELFKAKSETFEINTLNLSVVFILFLFGKLNRSIFIDHNASRNYIGVKKSILIFFLKKAKEIWIVNSDLKSFYPPSFCIKVISPFIPPDETQYENIFQNYPKAVIDFIDKGTFLVNSAGKFAPYKQTDLYGIETSVRLLDTNSDLRLLLAIAKYEPEMMPEKLVFEINKHIQNGRLCLLTDQSQIWPLFKHKAICLRLTPLDGDSVTIKEALYFKAPVVASNSVSRPASCIIYNYYSFEELTLKISELIT